MAAFKKMINRIYKINSGFTLIELVVVLAIASILVGGFGAAISSVNSADTQKLCTQITGALSDARENAMTRYIAPAGDGTQQFWGVKIDAPGDTEGTYSIMKGSEAYASYTYKKAAMKLNGVEINSVMVVFNKDGSVQSINGVAATGTTKLNFTVGKRESEIDIYCVTGKCEVK